MTHWDGIVAPGANPFPALPLAWWIADSKVGVQTKVDKQQSSEVHAGPDSRCQNKQECEAEGAGLWELLLPTDVINQGATKTWHVLRGHLSWAPHNCSKAAPAAAGGGLHAKFQP